MVVLFAMLTLSLTDVWGGIAPAYTLTPVAGKNNSYTGNCDIMCDGIKWNVTGNSQMVPWRVGGKSLTAVDREIYSKTSIADSIVSVVVTNGEASSITVNSFTLTVASDSDFVNVVSTVTGNFKASDTTVFACPAGADWTNKYYKFTYNITVSVTSNKFVQFSGAVFNKMKNAGEPDLTVSPASIDFGKVDAGTASVAGQDVTVTIENIEEVIVGFSTNSPFEADKESLTASGIVTITPTATTLANPGEYKDTLIITDAAQLTKTVAVAIKVIDPSTKPVLKEVNTIPNIIACYDEGVVKQNDLVKVTGYISSMFLKPSNFAKYGSVTVWLSSEKDGKSKDFQLYNCYGQDGDTLAYFGPNYTEEGTTSVDVDTIVSRTGYEYVIGDSIVAYGKIKKYNSTYELDAGCYFVAGGVIPTAIKVTKETALPVKKMMLNGQMVIIRDGKMFNALGAEL